LKGAILYRGKLQEVFEPIGILGDFFAFIDGENLVAGLRVGVKNDAAFIEFFDVNAAIGVKIQALLARVDAEVRFFGFGFE
jgi:hypothetical protein